MAGPIRIAILANGSQAKREITSVNGTLGRMGGFAKKAALTGFGALVLGAGAFAKSAIDVERKFSTSMRLIAASTGASQTEMGKLNDLAIKLGQDTSFSAGEAADAMLELAKAGLSTKTIMGGGLAGTLTLAAAGGTDLATASTIAANAMATFNLAGRDMDSIAAALAGGANASTASVESLGQALQQVGPGASNAGLSLQETVAALAAFDAQGIKGADAGTSLKTMLTRLVPSTEKASQAMADAGLDFTKANGEFVSLTEIARQLQKGMGDLSAEERTRALSAIFGSDATRAATALMKEGADGIRGYIKATNDQNAAQEQAAARMGGTEGALEKLSGAIETAKLRLGQELAPAITAGADALDDKLVPALETGIDAAKEIGSAMAPAVEEIVEALGNLAGEGDTVGSMFNDVFIPALKLASEIVGGAVDLVDSLPGPVKEIGIQAGIAALVLPRLTAGFTAMTTPITTNIAKLQQFRAELTYTETRAGATSRALGKFKGAATAAAGIGGMVALTQGAQTTSRELKVLYGLAGGAATGFAVGGPWGAAIGGGAGALLGLKEALGDTEEAMSTAKVAAGDYAASLDQITGASTRATRAEAARALQAQGAFELAREVGLSFRTVTSAAIGNETAIAKVEAAFMKQINTSRTYVDAQGNFVTSTGRMSAEALELSQILGVETKQFGKQQRAIREAALASGEFGRALKTVKGRAKIVSRLEMSGDWPTGARDVAKLTRGLNLTPKQIKTVLDVLNVDASVRRVKNIQAELKRTNQQRTRPPVDLDERPFRDKRAQVIRSLQELDREQVNPKTALDLAEYYRQRGVLLSSLRTIPDEYVNIWITERRTGPGGKGGQDGDPKAIVEDVYGPPAPLFTGAEVVGKVLGRGMASGVAKTAPLARAAGKNIVAQILAGVAGGSSAIDSALSKLTKLIEKRVEMKDSKKERARERAILKHLKDEYEALKRNGREQDRINRRLEKARQHLQEVRSWVDQVKQSFVETGNITTLGILDDGTVSSSNMLDELRDQVAQADRFAAIIRQLTDGTGTKINDTTLQQLLAAGPEAGLATAEALIAGGDAALAEINQLTQHLSQTGQQLGSQMSNEFFDVGLQAAEGIVAGLEAQQDKLDKIARKLARTLANAVRKALGIKSPSRVFREIGDNTIKGLTLGLDETYVKRAGATTADALVRGFGTPALDAYTAYQSSAAGAQATTVRVELTAEQISQLQAGKKAIVTAQVGRAGGGRQLAIGPK